MQNPWFSWGILALAYMSYGQFLHDTEVNRSYWLLNLGFAIALSGAVTMLWSPTRNMILKGFKSDIGYSVMVLLLASMAVVAVVQFRVTAYLVVLISSTLLARVDTLIQNLSNLLAFLLLAGLSLLGLGLSWTLHLLLHPTEALESLGALGSLG